MMCHVKKPKSCTVGHLAPIQARVTLEGCFLREPYRGHINPVIALDGLLANRISIRKLDKDSRLNLATKKNTIKIITSFLVSGLAVLNYIRYVSSSLY